MAEFTHRLPHQPWSKPSRNEEAYFHRLEFQERMAVARKREMERDAAERARFLEAHRDHCPACGSTLESITTQEGRAQQCPSCLGVWVEHETFARLTHPEAKGHSVLADILREVVLRYSTGAIPVPSGHSP